MKLIKLTGTIMRANVDANVTYYPRDVYTVRPTLIFITEQRMRQSKAMAL